MRRTLLILVAASLASTFVPPASALDCAPIATPSDPAVGNVVDVKDVDCGGFEAVNHCNGTVDYACWYCSHEGGNQARDWSNCENLEPGYFPRFCTLYEGGTCIVG